jgi:ABC-type multidrug transport system fused ATPase/permease subunit
MAALALLGVTVVMVLVAAAWDVVNPLPGPWRMVARLVVPAVLLVAWLQWVFRRAGGITPGRMAAEIEALNPEMGQKLRTAAEIQAKGISADATEEYRMLAGQVVREGNLAVTGLDAAPVLGTHRLRLAGAVGLLLVMVMLLLLLLLHLWLIVLILILISNQWVQRWRW